jgi:hypothetical protein
MKEKAQASREFSGNLECNRKDQETSLPERQDMCCLLNEPCGLEQSCCPAQVGVVGSELSLMDAEGFTSLREEKAAWSIRAGGQRQGGQKLLALSEGSYLGNKK